VTDNDGAQIRITVHAKARNTVEIRALALLASGQWHRLGTLCMPSAIWYGVWRRLLVKGAEAIGARLHIDERRAIRL